MPRDDVEQVLSRASDDGQSGIDVWVNQSGDYGIRTYRRSPFGVIESGRPVYFTRPEMELLRDALSAHLEARP